jgi:mannose-6-phosphate isomerase-like protein (cupin superfamily)
MFPRIKETVRMGALEINFLVDGDDTEGTLVQFEFVVPPNARVPAPHFHVEVDETLYILEGTLSQTIGTEIREMKAGDSCFIKRGVVHGFTNPYKKTARIFCTLTPATIGPAYFREIAEVINASGPPDMQKVMAIMKKHGLEPVKPV